MREPDDFAPSPSETIGPFFHFALTTNKALGYQAAPEAQGECIQLSVRVLDGGSAPVNDAMVEVWQADAHGINSHPDDPQATGADPNFRGFGRLATGETGVCIFETVRPGRVLGPDGL